MIAIILPDCQDASEYDRFLGDEEAARRLIQRRLRQYPDYCRFAGHLVKNGYHRKQDPTRQAEEGAEEGQTRIAHFRGRSPEGEDLFLSVYPGYLLPGLRTRTSTVLDAVTSLAEGGTIHKTAARLGVHPRTVSRWIRPFEEDKGERGTDPSPRAFSKAAKELRSNLWRKLKTVTVFVLADLLTSATVI